MSERKKMPRSYVLMLVAVAVFAVNFIAVLSYLNYRSMVMEMEERLIARVEKDTISSMEVALNFGKDFRNYYGIQDIFRSFEIQFSEPYSFILDNDLNLLYETDSSRTITPEQAARFIADESVRKEIQANAGQESIQASLDEHKAIFTPIRIDGETAGYFGCIYTSGMFRDGMRDILRKVLVLDGIFSLVVSLALVIFIWVVQRDSWIEQYGEMSNGLMRFVAVLIIEIAVLSFSRYVMTDFQHDYRTKIENSVRLSLRNLSESVRRVHSQGVELSEVPDLRDYIEKRVKSLGILHRTRVTDNISDVMLTQEQSNLMMFRLETGENTLPLYLEAEISNTAMERQQQETFFVILSTVIILLMFTFELVNLLKIVEDKQKHSGTGFSEEQIGLTARFTSFVILAAEYICMPFAAMMIRESGESLFGLSVGMTAALPLTVEPLMQMLTEMIILPKLKVDVRVRLLAATVLMAVCNITTFIAGSALVIVVCRALAGVAFQCLRCERIMIVSGCETEEGRVNCITQNAAGMMAGGTCGASMGAILAANGGYGITFACSAVMFAVYLVSVYTMVPFKAMFAREVSASGEEEKPVRLKDLLKIALSREVVSFSVIVLAPLFIATMLCITLIPAVCQEEGISAITLSYCYILNGIAGIYIGPALVSWAKKYLGSYIPVAIVFALTAAGIFVAKLPPVVIMVIITSTILGLNDGLASPLATDTFLSLKVITSNVDEDTALAFFTILSFLMTMAAPTAAELMLLPSTGAISPAMIGAMLYALAAVVIVVSRMRAGGRKPA